MHAWKPHRPRLLGVRIALVIGGGGRAGRGLKAILGFCCCLCLFRRAFICATYGCMCGCECSSSVSTVARVPYLAKLSFQQHWPRGAAWISYGAQNLGTIAGEVAPALGLQKAHDTQKSMNKYEQALQLVPLCQVPRNTTI